MNKTTLFYLMCVLLVSAVNSASGREGKRSGSIIVVASEAGAALDSDLLKGRGTDDTQALQRVLDRAKQQRALHLVVDGPALIRGLDVHSNTTIECAAGGGFYLKENSDRAIIRNANRSPDHITDKGISIRGCTINGNRRNQRIVGPQGSFQRSVQEPDGTYRSGLQFLGVQSLLIQNVTLRNILSFGAWISNARFVHMENITVDADLTPYPKTPSAAAIRGWLKENNLGSEGTGGGDDGLHFNGPIQYLTVENVKLRTWDDGLSFTANHDCGYMADEHARSKCVAFDAVKSPYVKSGAITDVTVNNVVFMDAHHGIRLLSADDRVDRMVISNVVGTIRERFAVISPWFPGHAGNFGSVVFSNINVSLANYPSWPELFPERMDTFADSEDFTKAGIDVGEEAEIPLFSLNGRIEHLGLYDVRVALLGKGRPIVRVGRSTNVESMIVHMSVRDPAGSAVPLKVIGKVGRLMLSLDWSGLEPFQCRGGSIRDVSWVQDDAGRYSKAACLSTK